MPRGYIALFAAVAFVMAIKPWSQGLVIRNQNNFVTESSEIVGITVWSTDTVEFIALIEMYARSEGRANRFAGIVEGDSTYACIIYTCVRDYVCLCVC